MCLLGAGVDHGREPCPYRIIGDIGGAFGMGAVGGGIWHLVKGTKNSPSGQRFRGGLEVSHLATPAQERESCCCTCDYVLLIFGFNGCIRLLGG